MFVSINWCTSRRTRTAPTNSDTNDNNDKHAKMCVCVSSAKGRENEFFDLEKSSADLRTSFISPSNMSDSIHSQRNIFPFHFQLYSCVPFSQSPNFQMHDSVGFASWFKAFDLTLVNESGTEWWVLSGRWVQRTRGFFVLAHVQSVYEFKVCANCEFIVRPDEDPFWQNVSKRFITSARNDTNTHTLRHIHLEHTRFNYKRDDLVLPFSGSFSQNAAHSRIAGFAFECERSDDDEIFTQRNGLLLLLWWLWFAHATTTSVAQRMNNDESFAQKYYAEWVLCERKGEAKQKKRLRHSRHTIHSNFFFVVFRSIFGRARFFRPTRLHAKEDRTFARTYVCVCVCRWQHISFAVQRFRSYMRLLILSFFLLPLQRV